MKSSDQNKLYSWIKIRLEWYSIGDKRVNAYPKWYIYIYTEEWWVKAAINGWKNKDIKGTWYIHIQEWWEKFNVGIFSCAECNGDIITEVAKVDNLVSTEGDIFEVTQKWAKVNVLCWCQIPLVIEWWMQMVFMSCHKQIICRRLCLYWWWVCSFAVHCDSGCIGRQINDFELDRIRSSTWNYNSAHLTKLFWLWDIENMYRDAGSIYCTVDMNISYIWMGAVARGSNLTYIWW